MMDLKYWGKMLLGGAVSGLVIGYALPIIAATPIPNKALFLGITLHGLIAGAVGFWAGILVSEKVVK